MIRCSVLGLFFICHLLSGQSFPNSKTEDVIRQRKELIQTTLQSSTPVITLSNFANSNFKIAQDLFLMDSNVARFYVDPISKGALLNEIFSVSTARPSDLGTHAVEWNAQNSFRVEMYNYAFNASIIGIVHIDKKQVIPVRVYKDMQPDIPEHLVQLAKAIAMTDTSVMNAFGNVYDISQPFMPGTKTALNRTKCQRSKHLCVAPTYVKEDKALWVIVDLTDLKVAGTRWTQVGTTGMAISQRSVQNKNVMECYCDINNKLTKDGWEFTYLMTRSDGLQVSDIYFKGKKYFESVKCVDWHVSYSNREGFGYSDAIGCPEFSTAAVLAVEPPYIEPIIEKNDTVGFLLGQRYYSEGWPTPCNYNYHQYFEFYRDGRFRPVVGSIGRGCGNNGIYRPVTRIHISGETKTLFEYQNGIWNPWKKEAWTLQSETKIFNQDHSWFQCDRNTLPGITMQVNVGQFREGGKGDNAYVYLTKFHSDQDEGESDLPTIGPCCNMDYQQGPEKFINEESIEGSDFVLWYVAQLKNDDRKGNESCWAESILQNGVFLPIIYPCYSGPMFTLMK